MELINNAQKSILKLDAFPDARNKASDTTEATKEEN